MVIAEAGYAERQGVTPMGRLVGYGHAGVEPLVMGMGPVPAVNLLLEKIGLKLDEIDLFEVNEAFAAQALAVIRELGLPPERTNPNGSGGVDGHPIGATGAILAVKALYELRRTGGRYAVVTSASAAGKASQRPSRGCKQGTMDIVLMGPPGSGREPRRSSSANAPA